MCACMPSGRTECVCIDLRACIAYVLSVVDYFSEGLSSQGLGVE